MLASACLLQALLAASPAGDEILATYQGGRVTRAEYESWLLGQGFKDEEASRRSRLEAIALADSLEKAARAAGLDRMPRTAFRLAQVETGLLAAALRRSVDKAIVITEDEVEAELKAEDKERYRPRQFQLRNIFKRVPPGASDAVRAQIRERMEWVRQQLLAGADFDDLAWRESDSQTRFRGGAMGYVPAGALHPDVDRVVSALKKGEVSAVLASVDGFTILRCDDISEARVIPLDEARGMIRQGLWSRASIARQAELRADLLREAAPRYAEPGGGDDAAAASFQGGRVTEAELRWLSGKKDALAAESRRALLEEQVVSLTAAARARAKGLDRDEALQALARWRRASLLATDEIARRLNESLVPPSDAEMRAHFGQNRERYLSPLRVDVSLIRWAFDRPPARAEYAQAEAVLARLRAGELAFEQAAREASTHPSAANGGRIGLVAMTDFAHLGPTVFRTIQELSPGQTSGVVQQDNSLYVVRLWERQAPQPLPFEEAARLVEQELGDARVAALQKEREAEALRALGFAMATKDDAGPPPPPGR